MADEQIQIVAVLPGGQFLGLGLIERDNVDVLIACLASLDDHRGHALSPSDVRHAYDAAKAARPGGNDADDDGA